MAKAVKAEKGNNGANLGYEAKLFAAADKMPSGVSPSEYKHIEKTTLISFQNPKHFNNI